MARDIYKSRESEINELIMSNDLQGAAKLAAKMGRQINQRFRRLEKANVGLKESAYRYAQRETGREKPRYSENPAYYAKHGITDIYYELKDLNKKITSKTSTIPGIKAIHKDIIEKTITGLEAKRGIKIDDHALFAEFMQEGGAEMLENRYLNKYQIFEEWTDYVDKKKITNEDLMSAYNEFKNNKKDTHKLLKREVVRQAKVKGAKKLNKQRKKRR